MVEPPFISAALPYIGDYRKENIMKSRLFIRALCVGAALLVPAGGLTTLGITTAGATTNQTLSFGSPSTVKLGAAIGTAILSGKQCAMTATVCSFTTLGQITITKSGTQTLKLLPNSGSIKVTQSATNLVITAAALRVSSFTLKGLTFAHCKITSVPATSLTLASGKWKATTVSMSGVTINTTGGTCTSKAALTTDFTSKMAVSVVLTTKAI
jgi:hypothetical protein